MGIVGAVIMPHNMYLHSALVKVGTAHPVLLRTVHTFVTAHIMFLNVPVEILGFLVDGAY